MTCFNRAYINFHFILWNRKGVTVSLLAMCMCGLYAVIWCWWSSQMTLLCMHSSLRLSIHSHNLIYINHQMEVFVLNYKSQATMHHKPPNGGIACFAWIQSWIMSQNTPESISAESKIQNFPQGNRPPDPSRTHTLVTCTLHKMAPPFILVWIHHCYHAP